MVFRLRQRFKEFPRMRRNIFTLNSLKKLREFNLLQFSQELLKFHLSPPFTSFYKEKKEWVSFLRFFCYFWISRSISLKVVTDKWPAVQFIKEMLSSNLQRFVSLFALTFSVNADLSPVVCLINLCDNCVIKKPHLLLIIAPNN
jgi:hypothetical protein